jgi:exopolyphosphatase/guanosine-5'-triphosphate,3'-diphosphate pyrophosphatase
VLVAALAVGRYYGFDEAHAVQVTRLALRLFDQLVELHGLGNGERYVLCLAGMLHDIGQTESYAGHHKRSRDIILGLELPGVTAAERISAAQVARYHRKKAPSEAHSAYAALPAGERASIRRLAALLRIADVCDREHVDRVGDADARIDAGGVRLRLTCRGGAFPVMDAFERKARLFQSEFGMPVWVETEELLYE